MKPILIVLLLAPFSQAAVLVQWTFETSAPTTTGPHPAEVGTGNASMDLLSSGTAATITNPAGNGSAESFARNQWEANDYYQFSFSTAGYSNISISFDQGSSGAGPRNFEIFYSTGGAFVSTGNTYSVLDYTSAAWSSSTANAAYSYNFNLNSIAAINNQSAVQIRLQLTGATSASGGTVSGAGISRIDNFTVNSATAVPEPSIALLGLLPMLGLLRRKR